MVFCGCEFAVPCVVICAAGPSSRFAFVFYVCGFKFWWFDSNLMFGVWVVRFAASSVGFRWGWWFCGVSLVFFVLWVGII